MIKKIVILGHTGFIGSHLESFLSKKHPGVEVIGKSLPALDLSKDATILKDYFDETTAVIMCAAVKKQLGDSLENCEKNMAMVMNVCRILHGYPVQRFLYFSSAAVYGENNHNLSINEETPIQPTSYYGIAKCASEKLLQKVMPNGLVVIRPPVIYGPGDQPGYGPSGFLHAAQNQETITLWGDGSEKREFIFVEDIVSLVEKLVFSEYQGILNLASGRSYTYLEILELVKAHTGQTLKMSSKERTQPKVDHGFQNHKLLKLFPTFRFTPLADGMQKMATDKDSGYKEMGSKVNL